MGPGGCFENLVFSPEGLQAGAAAGGASAHPELGPLLSRVASYDSRSDVSLIGGLRDRVFGA